MDHLRSYVRRLDKADRILKTQVFEGRECVGFEDRAGRGNNPPERLDRIWFDVETRLPARIERHYVNPSWDAGQTHIVIHDQFQYYAKVPVDLFTPQIPQGYVNAHPDDIRAARDRQVKGPMVYAEVPQGLKEKAVAALQAAGCGSYRQGGTTISFSENTWREDAGPESGGTTKWYIPRGSLPEGPFEADGRFVVTETMVDTANRTFRFRDFTAPPLPAHPMRYLLFLVRMTDRADRYEESVEKDGVQCYLFEISAKKYGDNPDGAIHRIWLDTRTSLPVRSESQWPRGDGSGTTRLVMDQFQWDPPLPDDHFVPEIPAGYTPADGKE
jgi:outer membrane lipoprotein-sorting protein